MMGVKHFVENMGLNNVTGNKEWACLLWLKANYSLCLSFLHSPIPLQMILLPAPSRYWSGRFTPILPSIVSFSSPSNCKVWPIQIFFPAMVTSSRVFYFLSLFFHLRPREFLHAFSCPPSSLFISFFHTYNLEAFKRSKSSFVKFFLPDPYRATVITSL